MKPIISLEHIEYIPNDFSLLKNKNENLPILNDISFDVEKGTVLGIIGESGCGKTTLAKVISGILEPTNGELIINVESKNDNSSSVQILFQNSNELINPYRKVGDILNESFKEKKKLNEICKLLDIPDRQFEKIGGQLSGGERQRIGLARILSADPELLILDEPFSAQDPASQKIFIELFKKIKSELNITIICISHDIKLVRQLADNIIVLYGGQVMEIGSSEKIFNSCRHPYTRFLNDASEYNLNRDEFVYEPESDSDSTSCAYYGRCGSRNEKCKTTVESIDGDQLLTNCNFPL